MPMSLDGTKRIAILKLNTITVMLTLVISNSPSKEHKCIKPSETYLLCRHCIAQWFEWASHSRDKKGSALPLEEPRPFSKPTLGEQMLFNRTKLKLNLLFMLCVGGRCSKTTGISP